MPHLFAFLFSLFVATSQNTTARAVPNAGAAKVLIPHESWTCGMPEGIPNPDPPAIDARYLWQTNDGDIIIVRNTGSGTLVPTFEVRTDSAYAWLNTGYFLSSPPGIRPGGVGITIYQSIR